MAKPHVALVTWRNLLWIVPLGALLLTLSMWGTPHLRFRYTYMGAASMFGERYYLECDYLGLHSQRIIPANGECPLLLLLKEEG